MKKGFEAELLRTLCDIHEPATMKAVLQDLLTRTEYLALQKRWMILRLLHQKVPQREIARQIDGSLCNVTRGARILRRKHCATREQIEQLVSTPTEKDSK